MTGDWKLILNQFLRRSVEESTDRFGKFTWREWFGGVWVHNHKFHTLPVLILGGAWVLLTLVRWRRCDSASTLARVLLGWGLLHVLIGRQGVLVHDWWWWPVTPGLVIAAALMVEELCRRIEARSPRAHPAIHVALAALFITFAWRFATPMVRFFSDHRNIQGGIQQYSIVEIGHAIQAAAAPNEAVVVSEYDDEPSLWYYGDRPLKWDIWDDVTLASRMNDGEANLAFRFKQRWTPPPTGLVFPKAYEASAPKFLRYLKSTFAPKPARPAVEEKFYLFDLTQRLQTPEPS